MVELTEHIKSIVSLHVFRKSLETHIQPYYDWYIGEKTGLHTYLTHTGVIYYGKQPLKYTYEENLQEVKNG